ncbi:transmembrane protein 17-like [Eriocheir sinensis]|uniref:transmembrane protein 17-like n=1 Tax=Eriocheir sinensis TaxID=95602 RepID=UPI0021C594A5|nr:transmembrane protein 17-like [Eriocheir sinensis]XP_050698852.1 transmembrane protein 17-like [Eriocheir sinensis]XP_050698853.1 transmembrane protein 17-like [Eriocheir sinensis]XP_050698854.1 transmembrane protein 17-like [Eriocheir sinensis]
MATHSAKRLLSNTVENLTVKFFPGISFSQLSENSYGNEAVASLPLQMVLYFSTLFFPCWMAASTVMITTKFQHVSSLYQWILVAIYTALPLIEVVRLYIGNLGNTEEKVPELAGSWLLTLLLQLPLLSFILLVPGTCSLPLDYAVNAIFLLFLVLHLVFGYRAVSTTAAHQTRLHHLYLVMGQGTESLAGDETGQG